MKKLSNQQNGWAIVGNHGLYTDWRPRRCDMIAKRVHDQTWVNEDAPSEFCDGARLDAFQSDRWARCRANGDRAVKVTISW